MKYTTAHDSMFFRDFLNIFVGFFMIYFTCLLHHFDTLKVVESFFAFHRTRFLRPSLHHRTRFIAFAVTLNCFSNIVWLT